MNRAHHEAAAHEVAARVKGSTMKALINWLRPNRAHTPESIRRTWDRERARAMSPSHRAEIDAIFSRYL